MNTLIKKLLKAFLQKLNYKLIPYSRFNKFSEESFFNELYKEGDKSVYLNVGAGRFRHSHWTNLDLKESDLSVDWIGNDINHDLLANTKIPLEDNSLDAIYASHVMEHIPQNSVEHFFRDAKRMLKPGSIMRISVPNTDLAINAFLRDDKRFFEEFYSESCNGISMSNLLVRYVATQAVDTKFSNNSLHKIDKLNNMGYQEILSFLSELCLECDIEYQSINFQDHVNWFNESKLLSIFENAGFEKINTSGFGQSYYPHFRDTRYFDKTLSNVSLYVEGIA
jgi:predicted SAM-dependent methyltransferase